MRFFRSLQGSKDFFKETHEEKGFGEHVGSVLNCFEAGNVNNDHKMPK